jgi:hypothetical protein
VVTTPPQRVRAPVNSDHFVVPPGVRPLGVMQRTHNGYMPKAGELPDPRFRPLLIVMDPAWSKRLPDYVKARYEEAISLTVEKVNNPKRELSNLSTHFIEEVGMRHYLGYRIVSDEVLDAIQKRLIEGFDLSPKDGGIPGPHRAMMTRNGDQIDVNLHASSGPFYMDAMLGIEAHYKDKLQRVAAA